MEIQVQIRGRVFSLSIGRKTKWFDQAYLISLVELWYINGEVDYGKMIWNWGDDNP